jgi:hypothetical protein
VEAIVNSSHRQHQPGDGASAASLVFSPSRQRVDRGEDNDCGDDRQGDGFFHAPLWAAHRRFSS